MRLGEVARVVAMQRTYSWNVATASACALSQRLFDLAVVAVCLLVTLPATLGLHEGQPFAFFALAGAVCLAALIGLMTLHIWFRLAARILVRAGRTRSRRHLLRQLRHARRWLENIRQRRILLHCIPIPVLWLSDKPGDLYDRYALAQKLWRTLPQVVTDSLGPRLCRYLATTECETPPTAAMTGTINTPHSRQPMTHADIRKDEIYDGLRAGFGDASPKASGYLSEYSFLRERALVLETVGDEPGTILDLACGGGLVTLPLAKAGHRVIGLDFNQAACWQAMRNGIDAIRGDAFNLPLADGVADLVLNVEVAQEYELGPSQTCCTKWHAYFVPVGGW